MIVTASWIAETWGRLQATAQEQRDALDGLTGRRSQRLRQLGPALAPTMAAYGGIASDIEQAEAHRMAESSITEALDGLRRLAGELRRVEAAYAKLQTKPSGKNAKRVIAALDSLGAVANAEGQRMGQGAET